MTREQNDRTSNLSEVFNMVWHTIQYSPYLIGELTANMLTITKFPDTHSHTDIIINEDGAWCRVKAECEVMTFTGYPADIAVLLEYIYWVLKDDELPAGLIDVFDINSLGEPSALPQLLIKEHRSHIHYPAMLRALEFYGFTAHELAEIGVFESEVKWLDIVDANDLWIAEGAGHTFPDVLREYGLLSTAA